MKKITLLFAITILFSSCATHLGITRNANLNSTEVVLTKNNFKVIKTVKGEAEAKYIFGFGGLKKDGLIAEAKSQMLKSAGMENSARTIVNETVEVKKSGFLFVNKYKIIVSAQIIEFIN
jgi:hypothetical protein